MEPPGGDLADGSTSAADVVVALGLEPHPEGGWYRSSYRPEVAGRPAVTAIYFLLDGGTTSRWHRVDATELWHHHAGASLLLQTSCDGRTVDEQLLGTAIGSGAQPQAAVPPGCWQRARSLGRWSLCGCTVSPGFEWDGFELAPEGWEPASGGGAPDRR